MRHLIDLVIYLALVIILYDCGSHRTIAANPPSAPLGKYTILEVKNVGSNIQNEDALEAAEEFPEMIVNRFVNYKDQHPQEMFFSQITRVTDEINQVLVLDCILVGYEKGSRAKRYFFNCFGLGKAYTTLQCLFIEKATGQHAVHFARNLPHLGYCRLSRLILSSTSEGIWGFLILSGLDSNVLKS